MDKKEILNIFNNKIPWIVRYGPILSFLCILIVALFVFSFFEVDFLQTVLEYLKQLCIIP